MPISEHPNLRSEVRQYSQSDEFDDHPIFQHAVQLLKDELWDAALIMATDGAGLVDYSLNDIDAAPWLAGGGYVEESDDFEERRPVLTALMKLQGWKLGEYADDIDPDEHTNGEDMELQYIDSDIVHLLTKMSQSNAVAIPKHNH